MLMVCAKVYAKKRIKAMEDTIIMNRIEKDEPKMRQLNRVPVKASKAQTICVAEEVASRAS